MTNRPHDHRPADGVDAALRAWRARHDPVATDTDLARRVCAAVRADAAIAAAATRRPAERGRRIERLAWFAGGIAAAAAVALVLRTWDRGGAAESWPPSVRFAAAQLDEKRALVAGMDEAFAGSLAWVAEHDRRVDVGLVPGPAAPRGAPLAVRIVVLTRRGDGAWEPAWQSDVVARDEEVVDVAAGASGAGRLRLWMHPLPDGAVAVDGDLVLGDVGLPLRASYSGVQPAGEPRRVTGDRVGDVEWQVIQTVMPLGPAREDVG